MKEILMENVSKESPYGNYSSYGYEIAVHGNESLSEYYFKDSKAFIQCYAECTLHELSHLEDMIKEKNIINKEINDFIQFEKEFLEFMKETPEEHSEYYDKRHKCIFLIAGTYNDIQEKLNQIK